MDDDERLPPPPPNRRGGRGENRKREKHPWARHKQDRIDDRGSTFTVESSISTRQEGRKEGEVYFPGLGNLDLEPREKEEEYVPRPPPKPRMREFDTGKAKPHGRVRGRGGGGRHEEGAYESVTKLEMYGITVEDDEGDDGRGEVEHSRNRGRRRSEERDEEEEEEDREYLSSQPRRHRQERSGGRRPAKERERGRNGERRRKKKKELTSDPRSKQELRDDISPKYAGMLKDGIPERIVRSRMAADGVAPPRTFYNSTSNDGHRHRRREREDSYS